YDYQAVPVREPPPAYTPYYDPAGGIPQSREPHISQTPPFPSNSSQDFPLRNDDMKKEDNTGNQDATNAQTGKYPHQDNTVAYNVSGNEDHAGYYPAVYKEGEFDPNDPGPGGNPYVRISEGSPYAKRGQGVQAPSDHVQQPIQIDPFTRGGPRALYMPSPEFSPTEWQANPDTNPGGPFIQEGQDDANIDKDKVDSPKSNADTETFSQGQSDPQLHGGRGSPYNQPSQGSPYNQPSQGNPYPQAVQGIPCTPPGQTRSLYTHPPVTAQPTTEKGATPVWASNNDPPPDYLPWSIITTLCCCLCLGIWAIITSVASRGAAANGDMRTAQQKSRNARNINIAGCLIGVVIILTLILVNIL
ncbi:unnamed protein product, partial [Owenia fusiformis]